MTKTESDLKLRGKKLYRDGQIVAEIRGFREWFKGEVHSDFWVVIDGITVSKGFCYFKDAVKWARFVLSLPEDHRQDFFVVS